VRAPVEADDRLVEILRLVGRGAPERGGGETLVLPADIRGIEDPGEDQTTAGLDELPAQLDVGLVDGDVDEAEVEVDLLDQVRAGEHDPAGGLEVELQLLPADIDVDVVRKDDAEPQTHVVQE